MNKGFTLVEILVAIAILTLIGLVVSNFQKNVIQYNKYGSDVLQSAMDAQSILKVMVAELRSIRPSSNGSYPIYQAATSSITFYSDIDDDGLMDQIRYFLSTTTLRKGIIKPTGSPLTYVPANEKFYTLAVNIKNATSSALFSYYNNTYSGTSSPMTQPVNISLIRLVKIDLTIDADPNRSPVPRTYSSQVMLRNLKDNL